MVKKIIIIATGGLVALSISLVISILLTKKDAPIEEAAQQPPQQQQLNIQPNIPTAANTDNMDYQQPEKTMDLSKRILTEKQLNDLIFETREKITEYQTKLNNLTVREDRIEAAGKNLRQEIQEIKGLRANLVETITTLKNERAKLSETRLEIEKTEKDNLASIATTYDKMNVVSASKILTNMSKMQLRPGQTNIDDVVKILYYMGDRSKAKVLAEISNAEPKLAALLSSRLKQIVIQ